MEDAIQVRRSSAKPPLCAPLLSSTILFLEDFATDQKDTVKL